MHSRLTDIYSTHYIYIYIDLDTIIYIIIVFICVCVSLLCSKPYYLHAP